MPPSNPFSLPKLPSESTSVMLTSYYDCNLLTLNSKSLSVLGTYLIGLYWTISHQERRSFLLENTLWLQKCCLNKDEGLLETL